MLKYVTFLVLFYISTMVAQNAPDEAPIFKHPLTDMPLPAEDVETSHYFPEQPDQKFPIGEVVTSLCHFSNDGSSYYNVSAIMGSLNSPFDFRHHYQNYSYKPLGAIVKAGEEISFRYNFQLHAELEPIDYQLAITVFYESESQSFSSTFFNETVELYYPTSDYDIESVASVLFSLFSCVAVAVITALACFPEQANKVPIVAKMFRKPSRKASVSSHSASTTDGSDADDEWLQDQPTKKTKSRGGLSRAKTT